MKIIVKSVLALFSVIAIAQTMLVYTDNQIINAYADDYGISKDNLYAFTHKWDKCPEEYSAYFDDVMGICWNDFAVVEWQDGFTDTDVGM